MSGERNHNRTGSLGLVLLHAGVVQPRDLAAASRLPGGEPLGDRLVKLHATTEESIATGIASWLRLPRATPHAQQLDRPASALVPRAVARAQVVCPLAVDGRRLRLAMADPLDVDTIREVEAHSGLSVSPCIATPTEIRAAIDRTYPRREILP
jgi:type IV pilus assembly protein PilB